MTALPSGVAAWTALFGVLAIAAALVPVPSARPVGARRPGGGAGPLRRVTIAVGSAVSSVLGGTVDTDTAARRGRAVLVVAAIVPLDARLAAVVAIVAMIRPVFAARRERLRVEAAVIRELPEVIDLVRLALSAGGSVFLAIDAVSSRPVGPVSEALGGVLTRVRRGHRIADALDDLPDQLGAPVRPLVRALVASERYGVELGPTLERIAAEARDERRRRAQTAARRVPVRMLLPLVLGVLPAFVLLTLVPTLVSTFDTLDLGGG